MKLKKMDAMGTLQGYVLVKSCDLKTTKNGSHYLDLVVSDGETDVVGKIWDYRGDDAGQPQPNTLIKVRGLLSIYNGQPQFKIDKYRNLTEEDNVNIGDYVPSAPFPEEDMFNHLIAFAEGFADGGLKTLALAVLREYKDRILSLPAAFRLHHAVRGGLLMHTLSICRLAEAVAALYPSVDRDLLLCGAILHDIAKSEEFNLAPTGLVESYTVEGTLIGHLVRGAMLVREIGKAENVPEDTLMLIEHMLISHHGIPEYGAAVRPLFLEAELLSSLDTLDANVFEIESVVKGVEKGGFTNKMWALEDRKFYNHGRKPVTTDVNLDWEIRYPGETEA